MLTLKSFAKTVGEVSFSFVVLWLCIYMHVLTAEESYECSVSSRLFYDVTMEITPVLPEHAAKNDLKEKS